MITILNIYYCDYCNAHFAAETGYTDLVCPSCEFPAYERGRVNGGVVGESQIELKLSQESSTGLNPIRPPFHWAVGTKKKTKEEFRVYEHDFYHEPSDFKLQIDEFKESLMKSVKEEYVAEMERLRQENAELREFKKSKQAIEQEIKSMKLQAELDKEEAQRQAKRARLAELMGGFEVEMWTPEYYYMDSRKCDRCNDDRKIPYLSPLGNRVYEHCTCAEKIKVYQPAKNVMQKISTRNDWGKVENRWLYYSLKNDRDYDSAELRSDDCAENLFISGVTAYEEVEKKLYRPFYFESYEECQKFCMWKMQKDAGLLPKAIESTESTQAKPGAE